MPAAPHVSAAVAASPSRKRLRARTRRAPKGVLPPPLPLSVQAGMSAFPLHNAAGVIVAEIVAPTPTTPDASREIDNLVTRAEAILRGEDPDQLADHERLKEVCVFHPPGETDVGILLPPTKPTRPLAFLFEDDAETPRGHRKLEVGGYARGHRDVAHRLIGAFTAVDDVLANGLLGDGEDVDAKLLTLQLQRARGSLIRALVGRVDLEDELRVFLDGVNDPEIRDTCSHLVAELVWLIGRSRRLDVSDKPGEMFVGGGL